MQHISSVYRFVTVDSVRSAIERKRSEQTFYHEVYINLYNYIYTVGLGYTGPLDDFVSRLRSVPFFQTLQCDFISNKIDRLVISSAEYTASFLLMHKPTYSLLDLVRSYQYYLDQACLTPDLVTLDVELENIVDAWNRSLADLDALLHKADDLGISNLFFNGGHNA